MNGLVAFFSQQTAEVLSGDMTELGNLDAFLYAIVGFCIVLAVLALLVLIFSASGMLFKSNFSFLKKKKNSAQNSEESASDNLSDIPSDDAALVAAITAAISCCMTEEKGDDVKPDFVIRRITKK